MDFLFSSNENAIDMEGIYDQRLPKSLQTINPNDIANNSTVSLESVNLLLEQLNAMIQQIPVVQPPTFVPRQTLLSRTVENEVTELIRNNANLVDAATNTTHPNSSQQFTNQPCFYLVPQKNDAHVQ